MEETLRNTLIIISALVIGAIFIHGLWTIRKNKNPYKLKAKHQNMPDVSPSKDSQGFDQDGIGTIKVVSKAERELSNAPVLDADEIPEQAAPAPDYDEHPIPKDLNKHEPEIDLDDLPTISADADESNANVVTIAPQQQKELLPEEAQPTTQTEAAKQQAEPEAEPKPEPKPLYADPVIQAKPNMRKKIARSASVIKRNQMEMNFGDLTQIEPEDTEPEQVSTKQQTASAEVLIVSVVVPEDSVISGAALLPNLLTLGMKFGEMQIFHRHQDNAGNGDSIFSLANWLNPGSFDLDNMETFETRGVSLFMQLPNPEDPFKVFEQMLAAANHLATEFHGQLLDGNRSVFNKQTEQHYLSKIREFERKKRINQF